MKLSRSDLMALCRKYQLMSDLRRSEYPGSLLELRGTLKRLSSEFPGALRELDILPLEEIDRREDALRMAAESGNIEPWMEWLHEYHVTWRAALSVKMRLAGRAAREPLDDVDAWRVAELLCFEHGEIYDAKFVQAALHPPEGRMNTLVFQRLEVTFGTAQSLISRTLFPERRPSRS